MKAGDVRSVSPTLRHVFIHSDRWSDVAAFYREIVGLTPESEKDDSVWFAPDGARLVVHDRDEEATAPEVGRARGFVVWFGVGDVDAAYARASAAGAVVGRRYDGYFFARDPEGRFIGVRGAARP